MTANICLVGGILPGSMPPNSTELWQEGAAIESEKVVSDGVFNEARMRELFLDIPSCKRYLIPG